MADTYHSQRYDEGSLTKLKIFELYTQAWIPVFTSKPEPPFRELHIFDLFCGPGMDSRGELGSPLRILKQLREYHHKRLAGWTKVQIIVHFSDASEEKVARLKTILTKPEWIIPGVTVDLKAQRFENALDSHNGILSDPGKAKFIIIDQFGVDAVTDSVFIKLTSFPTTDFIFFLAASTLHRFRDHPAIKIKIAQPEHSYDVHRAAFDCFQKLAPLDYYLGRFSIKKRSNIYGLIFGSRHPLGIHKFLEVAWKNDDIRGEANFDIDRENLVHGELLLPFEDMRPKKIQAFESDLEQAIRSQRISTEMDLIQFAIAAGMTCKHCKPVVCQLKESGVIKCEFSSPNIRNFRSPRSIEIL
jgi:three-Cys-motif partner protein